MNNKILQDGLLKISKVCSAKSVYPLQRLIYNLTKKYLVKHNLSSPINKLLKIPFDKDISTAEWGKLCDRINFSEEFKNFSNSDDIKNIFRKILNCKNPVRDPVCRFRAKVPGPNLSNIGWHQDMGVVYGHRNLKLSQRLPIAIWISLNGASKDDSIELLKKSHLGKLKIHKEVDGIGNFSANFEKEINNYKKIKIKTKSCGGVAFHPLTVHRTIPGESNIPRYSIDIRYYDPNVIPSFKVDFEFKFKRYKNIIYDFLRLPWIKN